MKIIVNDIAASYGGALTILLSFYTYLIDSKDNNEWVFFLSEPHIRETENIKVVLFPKVKKNSFEKLKFDFIYGKEIIKKYNPDAILSLQNIIIFGAKCPQYNYVHQSIPYQADKLYSFLKRDEREVAIIQHIIGKIIDLSIKYATATFVQTNTMKKAIIDKLHINPSKIACSFPKNIVSNNYSHSIQKWDRTSFFYPTGDTIYKNNSIITKACCILDERCKLDYTVYLTMESEKEEKNIHVKKIGRQSREMMDFYYESTTLIFPSLIETIGLPLIEAEQHGTLILAADLSYAHEILDGYSNVLFFNPYKPESLANLMEKIIKGKITKKKASIKEIEICGWERIIETIQSKR